MISTSLKRPCSHGCRRLSGGQLDGLYLCPRRNGKNPLAVLTGSGWNHWAIHPCSLLKAPFVVPPRMGSPKCTTSSRTAWLRQNIGSCRGLPLPGPAQWQRQHCQLSEHVISAAGRDGVVSGWSRDCRSHISEQTGDLYNGRRKVPTYRAPAGGQAYSA